jgi:hypothetical protein
MPCQPAGAGFRQREPEFALAQQSSNIDFQGSVQFDLIFSQVCGLYPACILSDYNFHPWLIGQEERWEESKSMI